MRRNQIGEVVLAMVVVMLVVMWLASGLMGKGKMEEDAVHAEKSGKHKAAVESSCHTFDYERVRRNSRLKAMVSYVAVS